MEIPEICILVFDQQEPPKMVAKTQKGLLSIWKGAQNSYLYEQVKFLCSSLVKKNKKINN